MIVRAPSSRPSTTLDNSSSSHDPPSRPPSRQRSQQPAEPPTKRLKPDSTSKGKGRETLSVREDPQVDEDVRQMESEADVLRRKSRAAESSTGFADPSFKFPATANPLDTRAARRPNHVDAIQPLALSETPQQLRNKTLREQGGTRSGRKSSLSMRGKRISNSYEATGVISSLNLSICTDRNRLTLVQHNHTRRFQIQVSTNISIAKFPNLNELGNY